MSEGMSMTLQPGPPQAIVIFGASGDLTWRMEESP
jgi:glucose-6-phosphate 1-dehydrogenase